MATQQVTPVTCPNCGTQFTAPIESIIDGQDIALKSAFLQGRLNTVQCPQCRFVFTPGTPVLYYDLEKEVAFVLAPNALQVTGADQEKMIGSLTNTLVNSLPAEERKFYLLNPKQFLSLDSMTKAILEADGISPEEFEAQKARLKLLEEFLQAKDETVLKQTAQEHEAELDRQFFEMLMASVQDAQMYGNESLGQALMSLRTMLARWSPQARKVVKELDDELGVVFVKSQEELLNKLQLAETDQERQELIAAGYPLLDYSFFQKLTAQIDEAVKNKNMDKANKLRDLRANILDIKNQQEALMQAAIQESTELLREILQSGRPEKTLAKKIDQIDQTFFMVLSANIQEAQRQKQEEAVRGLTALGDMAMAMIQDRLAKQQPQKDTSPETPTIHVAR